jgi:hypothetical protein
MAHRESRLQYECVKWYRNLSGYPQDNLWAVFNEGRDVNTKLSLGLRAGVSDLLLKDHRGLVGIEMKYIGETHVVTHLIRQAEWIQNVCDKGGFCDNLEQFKNIAGGDPAWYDPGIVLYYLRRIKTKHFVWDSSIFI